MPPEFGRMGLQIATWIVLVAAGLLLFLEPGSAERVVTQVSLLLGLVMGAVAWFIARGSRDRPIGGRQK